MPNMSMRIKVSQFLYKHSDNLNNYKYNIHLRCATDVGYGTWPTWPCVYKHHKEYIKNLNNLNSFIKIKFTLAVRNGHGIRHVANMYVRINT